MARLVLFWYKRVARRGGAGLDIARVEKSLMHSRPNMVFLFTDDQRFDTIRALGNPCIHTPNLDGLVARGTTFTHAHIPGGTVPAVCMPSRAMVNTGRGLFRIEGAGAEIPSEHATLGETLRRHGYRSFGAGKWHNGKAAFHRSFSDGAEVFFGGMADHWNVPVYDFDPTGAYDKTCLFVENPFASNQTRARACDHIHAGRHSTDIIADAAVRFIEQDAGAEPFFVYAAFLAPHDPRTMPAPYLALYDPASLPLPENVLPAHPFDNGELRIRDELLAAFPRTPAEVRRHLAEYYAMISHLDTRIGDIIEAVRRKGLLDSTVFVLAGDNGLALGQHGLFGKQSLYEHSIRVPLVFAGPGVPQGVRREALVYLSDIFPTLCGLAGAPVPASVEGCSLVPAMHRGGAVRESLYLAYADKHRGVRTGRHKLIEYVVGGRHVMTQLFDLVADPGEIHNLAAEAGADALVSALRRELFRLRDESGDPGSPWGRTFWSGYGTGRL
jgi:arylsulfatase A-like enzyme